MKVWILGAGGQLGSALIDASHSARVPCVSSKRSDLDITDLDALRFACERIAPTHIINCAAYTDVDRAEVEEEAAYAVNATGPANLGILATEFPVKVVHVSTDYVFDGEKREPYEESDPTRPINVYGKSKLEGELQLFEHFPTACVVRTSWIFGRSGRNFISSVLSMLQQKTHIEAVDDQVNRATYNRDLAMALLDLSAHSGLFHFANSEPISRYQIVQDFFEKGKELGLPIKCQKISPVSSEGFSPPAPRPAYSVLSTKKVEGVLGRKPRVWNTILGDYFEHAIKNS